MRIGQSIRKHWISAQVAVRTRWVYPADVAGVVISYGLFVFVFGRLWVAAFAGKADLAGYSLFQLTWYFIVSELVLFSVGNATFANLSNDVKSGQIAYALSRPWSVPWATVVDSWVCASVLALAFAVVGWFTGWLSVGALSFTSPWQVPAVLASLSMTLLLQVLIQFLLGMTALWTEENAAFLWIHQKLALVLGTFLPLEFFPSAWRPWIEATPYAWLSYPPARLATAFDPGQAVWLLCGQFLWLAILGIGVAVVFRAGRRATTIQGG